MPTLVECLELAFTLRNIVAKAINMFTAFVVERGVPFTKIEVATFVTGNRLRLLFKV